LLKKGKIKIKGVGSWNTQQLTQSDEVDWKGRRKVCAHATGAKTGGG